MSPMQVLLKVSEMLLVIASYIVLYRIMNDQQKITGHSIYNLMRKIDLLEQRLDDIKMEVNLKTPPIDPDKTEITSRDYQKDNTGWAMRQLRAAKGDGR